MKPPPLLSPEERSQALELAAKARKRRAEVKDALKREKLTISDVLEISLSEGAVAKMRVIDLLSALPWMGIGSCPISHGEVRDFSFPQNWWVRTNTTIKATL
jgi:hypothetical protein